MSGGWGGTTLVLRVGEGNDFGVGRHINGGYTCIWAASDHGHIGEDSDGVVGGAQGRGRRPTGGASGSGWRAAGAGGHGTSGRTTVYHLALGVQSAISQSSRAGESRLSFARIYVY